MRALIAPFVATVLAAAAAPAHAQTEWDLKQAFEGKFVIVKMDMPATQRGVDLYPDRQPPMDFREYSARVREFGVALKPGDRIMITTVRVKKKNIEFQLGGGGYGVFGDDSGYVYVPEESKSRREKDLEKWIKDERDSDRRRRLQRELDDLRRDRERENRRARSESRELTAQKESEIASKRLDAGSRFNLWFDESRLASRLPTPREMRLMLGEHLEFENGPGPRPDSRQTDSRPLPPPPPPPERGDLSRVSELRRGMSMNDVHDMLGDPTRSRAGKQGELSTITEWYDDGDRVTEVVYVGNVIVRFSTGSK
ncbi:MAG: hypothetical protein ABIT71_12535 [Vicinamibacteraceae bacterium]